MYAAIATTEGALEENGGERGEIVSPRSMTKQESQQGTLESVQKNHVGACKAKR